MNRMTPRRAVILVGLFALALPAALVAATTWKPALMPRDEEIAAALEAAPPALRDEAGVYVLAASGYEQVRASRNGFTCILERDWPEAFEPECYDAEGSATLLQATLLAAKLRMAGSTAEEIDRAVARAWAHGELRPPRRPGINYMLSERNRVPVDDAGTIIPYRPHVMFYAPYLTNADVGGSPTGGSPVFVINEGTPAAYVIVPVPREGEGGHH